MDEGFMVLDTILGLLRTLGPRYTLTVMKLNGWEATVCERSQYHNFISVFSMVKPNVNLRQGSSRIILRMLSKILTTFYDKYIISVDIVKTCSLTSFSCHRPTSYSPETAICSQVLRVSGTLVKTRYASGRETSSLPR